MQEMKFRPITTWPRKLRAARDRSPFKAEYKSTLKLLEVELRQVNARNPIIQLALKES